MTLKDAIKELKSFKVEYSGSGETVSYQTPRSGERVFEGETVKLFLN
mgnify:FL=1